MSDGLLERHEHYAKVKIDGRWVQVALEDIETKDGEFFLKEGARIHYVFREDTTAETIQIKEEFRLRLRELIASADGSRREAG